MTTATLKALGALDGRYAKTAGKLAPFMSEFGLIRARVKMQARYLAALCADDELPQIRALTADEQTFLETLSYKVGEEEANLITTLETKGYGGIKATKHDVVAALTWMRMELAKTSMADLVGWVHFGLTSEDCNNIAYGIMLREAVSEVLLPAMEKVVGRLDELATDYAGLAMLARTHGQPATPTTLGKELRVFASRLGRQIEQLKKFRLLVKLNGASGNYCAHVAAFPDVDWPDFARGFIHSLNDDTGLTVLKFEQNPHTTQIEPHDTYAELFGILMRFNTILLDCAQDCWRYISDHYLAQKAVEGEVGSSAMPHKVNPIDFENAEGNLGLANALLEFFCRKLPVSRLQRDLSDSTVERNFGTALGHCLLAYEKALDGLGKVSANTAEMYAELDRHPEVLAEGIQTILRRAGYADAYGTLKDLTRGQEITFQHLHAFIKGLAVPEELRTELAALRCRTYVGLAERLAAA